ncbi:MAG: hypothetical protein WDM88_08855 [Galbitalea sp.]
MQHPASLALDEGDGGDRADPRLALARLEVAERTITCRSSAAFSGSNAMSRTRNRGAYPITGSSGTTPSERSFRMARRDSPEIEPSRQTIAARFSSVVSSGENEMSAGSS